MSGRWVRAYVRDPPWPGGRAALDRDESHHLLRVLRVRVGDEILAFDGAGGEWAATVDGSAGGVVTVRLGEPSRRRAEPPVRVTLVQALTRIERLEFVLQKGTEIGVSAFVLAPTERAEAPPPSESRLARLRRVVLEASKQSGRLVLPTLDYGTWPGESTPGIVLDTTEGAEPIARTLGGPRRASVTIAVGPEGGLAPRELQVASVGGWTRCSLGPRALRTETAGAVAAALVLHAWGDLGSEPTAGHRI